jgi:hypothetical protein
MAEVPSEVQSISLYRHNGAKALIHPFSQADHVLFQHTSNQHVQRATKTPRDGGCRLKFQSPTVWNDYHAASVTSREILLDLVQAMQQQNMQLLCCADLNITGWSAGTLFFQRNPEIPPAQIACLQLGHVDKVRVVQLSEPEIEGLRQVLLTNWKYGVSVNDKHGIRGYKLAGNPWRTMETSNSHSVDAFKLVIEMLEYMESNGWSRVVSFDCSISDYDADSLLFIRESFDRRLDSQICAIALESQHKIRLIGASDEVTMFEFQNAVCNHWRRGVSETNTFQGTLQIKCIGRPWTPKTTEENIASAQLICGVLEKMWKLGWQWHCAIDMSVSVRDKSTFFLSRNNRLDSLDVDDGVISCLQPKGHGKVNLVSFPAPILQRVVTSVQANRWCVPLLRIEQHGPNCATIHFQCDRLHRSCQTAEKAQTAKVYTDLIRIVGSSSEDAIFLGTADISGNYSSGTEDTSSYSLDTDAFFFSFLS